MRADNAAEKLKAMGNTTATVVRDGRDVEIPITTLSAK
jgi:magnesium-transporting ATPase (P-type)